MKANPRLQEPSQRASTFIIVLWIAFGLVSITLYFAHAMSFELRASDNRVSGMAAEQAIEGAVRYVNYVLSNQPTNGFLPDPTTYLSEAVPVGEAHFWLIGRDTNNPVGPGQLFFGLVDEGSKLNLNGATSNMLYFLPRMTPDLTSAILDWRTTNSSASFQSYYAMAHPAYQNKGAPFETVDELRLLYGADMDVLLGEDANRNGVLDPNENDDNRDGQLEPGILDYVTVYSREPNTYSNGTPRINIRVVAGSTGPLPALLQGTFGAARATQILTRLGLVSVPPPGGGRGQGPRPPLIVTFASPLQFFSRSGMTSDEFGRIANTITFTTNAFIEGRVNVNTASAAVLACLPGVSSSPDVAQTLVSYRQTNPSKLTSIAWLVDALGQNNASTLTALQAADRITTQSFQFTADIAALGPHHRGYRRLRVVFDTTGATPQIIYRQDLTHLGWALGRNVRDTWLLAKETR